MSSFIYSYIYEYVHIYTYMLLSRNNGAQEEMVLPREAETTPKSPKFPPKLCSVSASGPKRDYIPTSTGARFDEQTTCTHKTRSSIQISTPTPR